MNEVKDIPLPEAKRTLKIGICHTKKITYLNERVCLARSLPFCLTGATPPQPDPGDPTSLVGGVLKRFGYRPPNVDGFKRRKFVRFVKRWLHKNLKTLTSDEIPSFEEWLEDTPYQKSRKEELTRVWDKCHRRPNIKGFRKVKGFCKNESYPEPKYPRLINSRIDEAKCYFGPVVQVVSDRLFAHPWFIKKVPVPERPKVIRDALLSSGANADYVFTDYTAFEAHFTEEVMHTTQVILFKHMLKNCPEMKEWLNVYTDVMTGTNEIAMKHFGLKLQATRMSGEMDTSLSNGFANLMLFLFCCHENGATDVQGFVEGDDGLFRVTPASAAPTKQQFADLGFTIKIESTKNLSEASFCGQVYDMQELIVVTDIREALARVGWTNKKYVKCSEATAMQLLRAKAYSLSYQYNGCPILSKLGRRLLHLTEGINIPERIYQGMDQWEREKLRAATTGELPEEIKLRDDSPTRAIVERLYKIPIAKQLEVEAWADKVTLGIHEFPLLDESPREWIEYYDQYCNDYWTRDPVWMNKPTHKYIQKLSKYPQVSRFLASL